MKIIKGDLKNKQGITLIALVITIIVLLILASISIAAISGDNSLLNRAGKAKEAGRGNSGAERKRDNRTLLFTVLDIT